MAVYTEPLAGWPGAHSMENGQTGGQLLLPSVAQVCAAYSPETGISE